MPIAVIAFDFDPLLRLGDEIVVRWQTVALGVVLAAILAVAGIAARRTELRADDVLMISIGAVPGAVIGGRLGYLLVRPDAFASGPASLIDASVGGLELAGAVVGGVLTAAYIAALLGAPVGRWAHLAAPLLLVAIGAGKLTMVLGGSGQGLPATVGWATAFLGPGPWGSAAPALPSEPSQFYEGLATLTVAVILVSVVLLGAFGRRDGRLLYLAIGSWAAVRAAITTTWRDPVTVGSLPAAGWLALAIAIACAILLVATSIRAWRSGRVRDPMPTPTGGPPADEPAWPDPATRPPY